MATPHQPEHPGAGPRTSTDGGSPKPDYEKEAPRALRLRVAAWDVVCTATLLTLLVVLATATQWPDRLFGFLGSVCAGQSCGLVPYGVDMYIYPVVWGGLGAAVAAAAIGPVVSLLKGWYMFFWPVLALALITVSSAAGSILTTFSERYWR